MLKYITLGTDCKEYFFYDGKPLPIRPLSSYELDQAFIKAVESVSPLIFSSVMNLKLNIKENIDIKLDKNNYKDFMSYYNEVDYWIVYFAIKDFQEEDFSFPDYGREHEEDFEDWDPKKPIGYYYVRKMKYVHEISKDVMSMTSQPPDKLMEVLTNASGKALATLVHVFHQPLNSKAWKLTPLQIHFILYSRPGAPYVVKSVEDLPGVKKGKYSDIMKQLEALGYTNGQNR